MVQEWQADRLKELYGEEVETMTGTRKRLLEETWCEGVGCQSNHHQCAAGPINIHGLNDKIPCSDMAGNMCSKHAAHQATRYFLYGEAWNEGKTVKNMMTCDARRGIKTNLEDLEAASSQWTSGLLPVLELSPRTRERIVDVLLSDADENSKILGLQRICPLLS
ncbi:unnamed protein product [Sympodiomycopsis kandeliae]